MDREQSSVRGRCLRESPELPIGDRTFRNYSRWRPTALQSPVERVRRRGEGEVAEREAVMGSTSC